MGADFCQACQSMACCNFNFYKQNISMNSNAWFYPGYDWNFGWHVLIILCLLFAYPVQAIVNMDNVHFKQQQEGVSGSIEFQASSSSGNTRSSNVSFDNQIQWNSQQHINLVVLGYEYGETDDTRNLNKSFIHARHVYHYAEPMDLEFFAQAEENEFTRLKYRGLLGGGIRLPFAEYENHSAYLGLGGFREVEKTESNSTDTAEMVNRTGRWNIYLMSRYRLGDRIKFSNTLYWQPRMADSADRRALFISRLTIMTTRQFSMQFSFESVYDSLPPVGVEKKDSRLKTGFSYSF